MDEAGLVSRKAIAGLYGCEAIFTPAFTGGQASPSREFGLEGLLEKQCKPCEGGAEPLSASRVGIYLGQVRGWQADQHSKAISRRFEFRGFYHTISFINALAWIATRQGHHPDFRAGYNYCDVTFTTHAINGLSENDFICAARVNAMMEN